MGLPTLCFTCGKAIGHLYEKMQTEMATLLQGSKVCVEMEHVNGQVFIDGELKTHAEKFFDTYKIRRYCCRRMLLSSPPNFPQVFEHQIPVAAQNYGNQAPKKATA